MFFPKGYTPAVCTYLESAAGLIDSVAQGELREDCPRDYLEQASPVMLACCMLENKIATFGLSPELQREVLTAAHGIRRHFGPIMEQGQLVDQLPGVSDHDKATSMQKRWQKARAELYDRLVSLADRAAAEYNSKAGGDAGEGVVSTEPLTHPAAKVLEILQGLKEYEGLKGDAILDALATMATKEDPHGIIIDNSTLTGRIIPELRPYGVRNKRGVGYYIDRSKSSST